MNIVIGGLILKTVYINAEVISAEEAVCRMDDTEDGFILFAGQRFDEFAFIEYVEFCFHGAEMNLHEQSVYFAENILSGLIHGQAVSFQPVLTRDDIVR